MTPKDKATDARLRRIYGISLADYDTMFARQDGKCWICGKPPKHDKRLHVDHDHALLRNMVVAAKNGSKQWYAYSTYNQQTLNLGVFYGKTKKEALTLLFSVLKRLSVRGLLCWQDNAGLQKFRDNPDRLEAAAKYLREYKEKGNQLG